jgi:hypothetical protein
MSSLSHDQIKGKKRLTLPLSLSIFPYALSSASSNSLFFCSSFHCPIIESLLFFFFPSPPPPLENLEEVYLSFPVRKEGVGAEGGKS